MASGLYRVPAFCVLSVFLFTASAGANDWRPIDPAHLALAAPKVQPGADAEAIFWDVRVADGLLYETGLTTTFEQYLRVKIFTDRGREMFATVDIPYTSNVTVRDIAARTIKPDGAILELNKDDVYRRTLVKANDLKIQVISFAVPGIEKGVIVEYRWREVYRNSIAMNLRLPFSREIPVQEVRYYVRPLAIPGVQMQAWPFNGTFSPPQKERDHSTMIALSNVPADVDEEYGPPPFEHRPWVFITYEEAKRGHKPAFVQTFGKLLHEQYGRRTKPNDEIRALAAATITGVSTDADKLAALARVARARMKRIDVDTSTDDDRRAARENKNAGDVLKHGFGTEDDAVILLLALANAAGFDARVAAAPNRADLFERSVQQHPYFFAGRLVAIRSGDGWLFADPGNEYAAAGQLRWQYEHEGVVIADPKDAVVVRTPLVRAEYSVKRRTGTFKLLDDGTLEGDVRLEFAGHWADMFREQEDQDAPSEREKTLKAQFERRLPGAQISDITFEHTTDPSGPYANTFKIRIPGYAQRTGTRLFLQPAVFQKGLPAVFQSLHRKTEIHFPFAWTEEDVVRIELPAGYALEEPERPAPLDAGAVSYDPVMTVASGNQIVLRRNAVFGKGSAILFPSSSYETVRKVFETIHRGDSHALVLRKKDGTQ
jgi:transglutaminase-like putative cysteine protease